MPVLVDDTCIVVPVTGAKPVTLSQQTQTCTRRWHILCCTCGIATTDSNVSNCYCGPLLRPFHSLYPHSKVYHIGINTILVIVWL